MDVFKQIEEVAKRNGVSASLVQSILVDYLNVRDRDRLWWNKERSKPTKAQPPATTRPTVRQRTKTLGGVEQVGPIDPASYD